MLKKSIILVGTILAFGFLATAQEVRSEVTVSGTGLFTKDSNNNGLQHQATKSGGIQADYRFNLNRWAAAEFNYGLGRNSQEYFTSSSSNMTALPTAIDRIQTNVHAATLDFVARIPTAGRVRPYVLAGGGALIFDPVHRNVPFQASALTVPTTVRVPTRAQGAFVYGAGADFDLTHRGEGKPGVALRLGYRGYVYDVPDFGFRRLDLQTKTHTAQPEAGLTFRF